ALHVHLMPTRTDVILLDRQTGERTVMVEGEEASTWVQIVGGRIYAVTNLGSPRGRVVTARLDQPQAEHWETIVAESVGATGAVIEGVVITGRSLLVTSTEHAVSRLRRHELDGTPLDEVGLPELGSITGLDADPHAGERAFLTFTSFARPPGLWRWTPDDGLQPWALLDSPLEPGSFVAEQVFYPSTDGTDVSLFLVRAAATEVGPDTPTLLSAYGGFAIASSPGFAPGLVAFCEAGGVYAIAGIRGGGEYGEDWHRAGMRAHKQQVFDDFHAAADWLVAEGRTRRDRLALRGGSNGGLLMGAAITQRPDLAQAVICAVPLLDMLRYQRFL